ncbi:sodium/proline symporter PutP [Paraferrimonas haliotis]|uniref:Sodium/proline symporter n=1 Tax=Paraferrimonas haliotis TaxID=2013866 RepID=A0AA37TT25_9GAMM|nr:sodium/proline symporter PutP [Paraferrimonas haliotis]GLS82629.1 sodium:proline symporter [Paraferrimonas haliotis]
MSIETPILITFVGYLALMILVGFIAYRNTNNVGDYILGGRKMGPAVTALSVGASDMSGWLLLGLPGAVYLGGLSEAWIGFGLIFGAWLNWLIVAKRLRVYTQSADDALTIPEFLESRFQDKGGSLRTVAAIVILLFFTFYASSGLVGGAILFEKVFGLDYTTALLIGSAVIVTYTFVGGFFAVSWTDFFQGCLMLLALIFVPISLISELGGWSTATAQLPEDMYSLINSDTTVIGLVSLLAWGLGYFGQPHILSRFMAIRSIKDIALSRHIAMGWMTFALIGALVTGLVGAIFFANEPLENPETVFIHLTQVAFNPWVAGILIAAILSAIMSTIDSQLLVCSSVITEDVYKKWIRPNAKDNELMRVGRFGVLLIAIVAALIALNPDSNVLGLVSYAWAGFGAAFGPVVLLSLFWRNYSRNGALATLIVGAITVVIWKQLHGGLFDLYEILPGFVFATLAGWLVSKLSPNNNEHSLKGFDEYQAQLK